MPLEFLFRKSDPEDPSSGTEYWYDPEKDRMITRYVQDVESILNKNKREANASLNQRHKSEAMNKVASIPNTVVLKWKFELGVDIFNPAHADKVKKLLNDPEWRYLRTRGGKI